MCAVTMLRFPCCSNLFRTLVRSSHHSRTFSHSLLCIHNPDLSVRSKPIDSPPYHIAQVTYAAALKQRHLVSVSGICQVLKVSLTSVRLRVRAGDSLEVLTYERLLPLKAEKAALGTLQAVRKGDCLGGLLAAGGARHQARAGRLGCAQVLRGVRRPACGGAHAAGAAPAGTQTAASAAHVGWAAKHSRAWPCMASEAAAIPMACRVHKAHSSPVSSALSAEALHAAGAPQRCAS